MDNTLDTGNEFLDVIKMAKDKNWCTRYFCTTCGAMKYRNELKKVFRGRVNEYYECISSINVSDLMSYSEWLDALEISIRDLTTINDRIKFLRKMSHNSNIDIRLLDILVYAYVKRLPNIDIKEYWINRAMEKAIETEDFSLVETLLLVLKEKSLEHEKLMKIARKYALHSPQMKRVLFNACGIS